MANIDICHCSMGFPAEGPEARNMPRRGMRVAGISDELQEIVLEDERVLACRLVVVASGANWRMHRQLQLPMTMIEKNHSTSFGFSLKSSLGHLPFDGINFLPNRRSDLVDFLTLFPVPDGIRGNLLTYQAPGFRVTCLAGSQSVLATTR